MSFSTTGTEILYDGNGVTDIFPIPFNRTLDSEIIVELWDLTDPDLIVQVTPFTVGVDYSLIVNDVVTTVPVPTDFQLLVYRATNDAHDTLYDTYQFPYPTVNIDLDQVYQRLQELATRLGHTIIDTRRNVEGGLVPLTMQDVRDLIEQVNGLAASIAGGTPPGGLTGDALVKLSDADADVVWESQTYAGYSSRFSTAWDTTGIRNTLLAILNLTYLGPQVSLSASGSGTVREKGNAVTAVTLTATTTKRTDDIASIEFFFNGTAIPGSLSAPPANPGGGAEVYNWTGSFSDNVTFRADAIDDGTSGGPTTGQGSASFTFVYPYYFGAGAVALSAAAVAALTKDIRVSTASLNKTFTATAGQVYYFAYPASYGVLTSILDENGFQVIADWTLRVANITGLDASAVSYNIYEFNNPVAGGTTNYTFTR